MYLLIYNIFLFSYKLAIRLAALFNDKAERWVKGRRDLLQTIRTTLPHNEKRIWFHCASVGEFEQARPLIEQIKRSRPHEKILLTFFSPSGYELRKDYPFADYVFYLPLDGKRRSARFIRAVNPHLAVFVKYEFWYYYACNLELNKIPFVLICGHFREEQPFFKWYGELFRKLLQKFSLLFVQDESSTHLLKPLHLRGEVLIAGDTRYDRVAEIAAEETSFTIVENWKGKAPLLIAGSTWNEDEIILNKTMDALPASWNMVIAPHEINEKRLAELRLLFPDALFYSELKEGRLSDRCEKRILVVDTMGMLAQLYRYGAMAFVGGGFSKEGIHNTLEPAVFGLPIVFGPFYEKFSEAKELVSRGFAFPVKDATECRETIQKITADEAGLELIKERLREFVQKQRGATQQIFETLKQKEWI